MLSLDEISSNLKETGKYWISFTGDSIASCEWVHPNWRDIVIYVLQKEVTDKLKGDWKTSSWGLKGFNFAYDGSTTTDIVHKLNEILAVEPQLLIGTMGGNDPVLNVSVEESVANIKKIEETANSKGTKIIWASSTPAGVGSKKNPEYDPYSQAFLQIPNSETFLKIDLFNLYQKFPTEKFFTFVSEENPVEGIKKGETDLQHPNQLGNAYLARVILKEGFGIEFDPEKYITETLAGEKYPGY